LACLFLPYFGLIFNESILRGLFEHNLFELAFKQQGLIYYYTLMGQNIKKIPPAFNDGEDSMMMNEP